MPYLYILECADGSYYTGSTKDLKRRLVEHEAGVGSNHTADRLPVKLIYFEEYLKVDEAFNREKHVQKWSHAKRKALVEGNTEALKLETKKEFKK